MFWECHVVTSSIDKLLDQPDESLKLQDFLDESDLIQECLTQNKRLIDYLVRADVMNELISHVIQRPTDDNYRNAHIVSELLSGDFPRIQQALLEKEHLDRFYSFLLKTDEQYSTATLNPILASYFSRILMTLIIRKPAELFNYLKSRSTFKEDFLRHLDTTSISDILYRLIADCADYRTEAIRWYEEINLIDGIFEEFSSTDSIDVQLNIVNVLSEFLRLAFDQHNSIDNVHQDHSSSAFASYPEDQSNEPEMKSRKTNEEKQFTTLTLAQHILSRKNLESLFDTMSQRPIVVTNGCDFLVTFLDLLIRSIPGPLCIASKDFFSDERYSANYPFASEVKDEEEKMQINDEANDGSTSNGTESNAWKSLHTNAADPFIRIYLTFIDIISSQLEPLIAMLAIPAAPLTSSSTSSSPSHDSSQTVKYQFISEPLGSLRLNLIKFFSKLIFTISNDYTGDHIYQILNNNRFLHILVDLFHHHIYNNFLHTQVHSIVRLLLQINALAVKQSDDLWTRTPLRSCFQLELPAASTLDYTSRGSYQLFQSLLSPSEVNLIERLLDQYELNLASNKSITTSSSSDDALTSALLHARFSSPNSGHVVQMLRSLREHASTFGQYLTFMKNDEQSVIDDSTNIFEIRWQTALDYLAEDEKKCAAMHQQDRHEVSNFRMNASAQFMAHIRKATNSNDASEAIRRRQTFHMRSFGISGAHYIDDDDDEDEEAEDEDERFEIDDESMENDRGAGERKIVEIKKISFEPQFPSVFHEPPIWEQSNSSVTDNDSAQNTKVPSMHPLPDLFENHRMQQEKSANNESNFEQLCSLRANDHGSGPLQSPFQATETPVNGNEEECPDEF